MKRFLFTSLLSLILIATACVGCHSLSPAAQQTITRGHDAAAVQAAEVKDAGTVAEAKAEVSPAQHPIEAANVEIEKARVPLRFLFIASFIVLAITVGLAFTPLSAISKVAVPVAAATCALSLGGIIALPFFPWVFLGALALVAGLFLYEVFVTKSIGGAVKAVEADFIPETAQHPAPVTVAQAVAKAVV